MAKEDIVMCLLWTKPSGEADTRIVMKHNEDAEELQTAVDRIEELLESFNATQIKVFDADGNGRLTIHYL